MKYNPDIHHRRSIRLKGYDYSKAGMYFVTICCQNRQCIFGEIENGEMALNNFGKIASDEWVKLSEQYPNVLLDVFQIMPNHIHGIITLGDVGATLAVALNENAIAQNNIAGTNQWAGASPAPTRDVQTTKNTIGNIVGAYKSLVANKCLEIFKSKNEYMGKLWQRNYWEHIIRDEESYQRIANYIINNPINWKNDKFFAE